MIFNISDANIQNQINKKKHFALINVNYCRGRVTFQLAHIFINKYKCNS